MSGAGARRFSVARALAGGVVTLTLASAAAGAADIDKAPGAFRIAVFNVSLARGRAGALIDELREHPTERARGQIQAAAEIIQIVRPDVVLLLEFDFDPAGEALDLFERELAQPIGAGAGMSFAYRYAAPVNTGLQTGFDLDGGGGAPGPEDAQGWGVFEGQFGMALLSQAPIDLARSRQFQRLLWSADPVATAPQRADGALYYPTGAWETLRLSSKSHWDLALTAPSGRALHILASHPTPPVFDGPENRNGLRNAAEIRFWASYIDRDPKNAAWIVDDTGRAGGLAPGAAFVLLGDMNADPYDGASPGPIAALLAHPRLQDPQPRSQGGRDAAAAQDGANANHRGDPALDTADWKDDPDGGPGNLRVDYVLPSRDLTLVGSGVFWPAPADPLRHLVGDGRSRDASDHRLVWVDLDLKN